MEKNRHALGTGGDRDVKIGSDLGLERFQAQPIWEIPVKSICFLMYAFGLNACGSYENSCLPRSEFSRRVGTMAGFIYLMIVRQYAALLNQYCGWKASISSWARWSESRPSNQASTIPISME